MGYGGGGGGWVVAWSNLLSAQGPLVLGLGLRGLGLRAWGQGLTIGALLKKSVLPFEMSNTCKHFLNPKITKKFVSIGTPPPFSTQIFFYQNDSEWPKMDFKQNFENRKKI